jgi:hypothetical protein
MSSSFEYDRKAASISHQAFQRFRAASLGWNGLCAASAKNS